MVKIEKRFLDVVALGTFPTKTFYSRLSRGLVVLIFGSFDGIFWNSLIESRHDIPTQLQSLLFSSFLTIIAWHPEDMLKFEIFDMVTRKVFLCFFSCTLKMRWHIQISFWRRKKNAITTHFLLHFQRFALYWRVTFRCSTNFISLKFQMSMKTIIYRRPSVCMLMYRR